MPVLRNSTKDYDKRYCFNVKDLKIRIDYVVRQG